MNRKKTIDSLSRQLVQWSAVALGVLQLYAASHAIAAEWHVSPQGSSMGNGSKESPWDLRTALRHPSTVHPGDTIWLHEGTYKGRFEATLKGTEQAPIVVRQYPGARAVVDADFNRLTAKIGAHVLTIGGAYTWYWGFELSSSYPHRKYAKADYAVVEKPAGPDIGNSSVVPGIKLINLRIHDLVQGPGVWLGARDHELYGCIIFNNGYDAPDRGHGHGTYTQNETTTRKIVDNIIFNQYSYGIHAYGSSKAFFNNFHVEGNMLFNNGSASTVSGYTSNLLLGGGRVAERPVIQNNYCYYPTDQKAGICCRLNYGKGSLNAVVKDNYIVSGGRAFTLKGEGPQVAGNTFIGATEGCDSQSFPANSYMNTPPKEGVRVFVRPNQYEPGRAHICVFNWDHADHVRVDVSSVLKAGDAYQIRDVQDVLGPPAVRGTYAGSPIDVPMSLTAVTQPVGMATKHIAHTSKEFNAFLLTATVKQHP